MQLLNSPYGRNDAVEHKSRPTKLSVGVDLPQLCLHL